MVTDDRIYQAYYTKSAPIIGYMIDLLNLQGNEKIFEPCAGDGVFIDPILKKFKEINIDAFELNINSFNLLSNKYSNKKNITIKQTDTLTDIDLALLCSMGGKYDAVIANPPYGAWRTTQDRKNLKKIYNGFYAKESYSLFLYRSIEALKEKGKLVFIIPDTYLNLHNHKDIRKYILTKTKIKEIALFPSTYFPGVNFGYANLSIIALEKCGNKTDCLNNNFEIIKGFKSVEELNTKKLNHLKKVTLSQEAIFKNQDYSFITATNPKIVSVLQKSELKIENIANCVTGFYSGNDKEFLKVKDRTIRNSKRYDLVNLEQVELNCNPTFVNGIMQEKSFVPIVKGGNTKYYKPDNWFMKWSKETVQFFKKNKKARYQNANFYFKKGIAVPMVSSKSITAALIENRLFDQSIVGIFPKKEETLYLLLAFFNSPTCNKLIRTINPSANNSANYIKKIPIINPSIKSLLILNKNIKQILKQVKGNGTYNLDLEAENNSIFQKLYGF